MCIAVVPGSKEDIYIYIAVIALAISPHHKSRATFRNLYRYTSIFAPKSKGFLVGRNVKMPE